MSLDDVLVSVPFEPSDDHEFLSVYQAIRRVEDSSVKEIEVADTLKMKRPSFL